MKNRKAFSMIELIFVIVILGILAAIAIPKLAATRDDAYASKDIENMRTIIADLEDHYTAHGKFNDDWTQMTNVAVDSMTSQSGASGQPYAMGLYMINGVACVGFDTDPKYPGSFEVVGYGNNTANECLELIDLMIQDGMIESNKRKRYNVGGEKVHY